MANTQKCLLNRWINITQWPFPMGPCDAEARNSWKRPPNPHAQTHSVAHHPLGRRVSLEPSPRACDSTRCHGRVDSDPCPRAVTTCRGGTGQCGEGWRGQSRSWVRKGSSAWGCDERDRTGMGPSRTPGTRAGTAPSAAHAPSPARQTCSPRKGRGYHKPWTESEAERRQVTSHGHATGDPQNGDCPRQSDRQLVPPTTPGRAASGEEGC